MVTSSQNGYHNTSRESIDLDDDGLHDLETVTMSFLLGECSVLPVDDLVCGVTRRNMG